MNKVQKISTLCTFGAIAMSSVCITAKIIRKMKDRTDKKEKDFSLHEHKNVVSKKPCIRDRIEIRFRNY